VDALKPVLTGWAQVHGRDEIALQTKVDLDRYYLEEVSPLLGLRILLRTLVVLFSDRGVF
jgi:O-antigen biosynthesis protein WbqP